MNEEQQQQAEEREGDVTWHRVERSSNFSSRALRFPDAADLSKVNATMEGGVLRIDIGKRPESQAAKQQIKVA